MARATAFLMAALAAGFAATGSLASSDGGPDACTDTALIAGTFLGQLECDVDATNCPRPHPQRCDYRLTVRVDGQGFVAGSFFVGNQPQCVGVITCSGTAVVQRIGGDDICRSWVAQPQPLGSLQTEAAVVSLQCTAELIG